jgi:hypothetical protein
MHAERGVCLYWSTFVLYCTAWLDELQLLAGIKGILSGRSFCSCGHWHQETSTECFVVPYFHVEIDGATTTQLMFNLPIVRVLVLAECLSWMRSFTLSIDSVDMRDCRQAHPAFENPCSVTWRVTRKVSGASPSWHLSTLWRPNWPTGDVVYS